MLPTISDELKSILLQSDKYVLCMGYDYNAGPSYARIQFMKLDSSQTIVIGDVTYEPGLNTLPNSMNMTSLIQVLRCHTYFFEDAGIDQEITIPDIDVSPGDVYRLEVSSGVGPSIRLAIKAEFLPIFGPIIRNRCALWSMNTLLEPSYDIVCRRGCAVNFGAINCHGVFAVPSHHDDGKVAAEILRTKCLELGYYETQDTDPPAHDLIFIEATTELLRERLVKTMRDFRESFCACYQAPSVTVADFSRIYPRGIYRLYSLAAMRIVRHEICGWDLLKTTLS